MTKAKTATKDSKPVKIERTGWEIDPAHVVDVIDNGDEVIVRTQPTGKDGAFANYPLTREEAAPFMEAEAESGGDETK